MSVMKKYNLVLIVVLFFIIGADSRQAKAYSVELQKDGIYAEVLPDSVVNNAAVFFEKSVKKAMKYYKKYKDAGTYTLLNEVPAEYRDFIPVARKIQDSDEIIIRYPFYIYDIDGYGDYKYYFVAEKDREKLCLFSVDIHSDTGKICFWYDKLMDRYFLYDEKLMKDAIFYRIDDITYAQTPEETSVVRDQKQRGTRLLEGGSSNDGAKKAFKKKNYEGKKDEIFDYLKKKKEGKIIEKSDENMKLELKDDYIETEKDTKEGGIGKGVSIVFVAAGVVVIVGITAGIIFRKRRKRE